MDTFIHIANVLFLLSYLVRDILWLRVLTVIALVCLAPFYYFQPEPLYAPIAWNVVFGTINIYQIYKLLMERCPATLTIEQQMLYNKAFQALKPREFLKLMELAQWQEAAPAEVMVQKGQCPDHVMIICSGVMDVIREGKVIAELHDGQFVGEMNYLTGCETSADVVAREATQYISWSVSRLNAFLDDNLDIKSGFQSIIGTGLSDKLRHQD